MEKLTEFKTGQEITTTAKSLPLIKHRGIIFIQDDIVYVMHNTADKNVSIEEYEDFMTDRELLSVKDTALCLLPASVTMDEFKQFENKKFNLLSFNCEHFVSDLQGEAVESESVDIGFKALLVFASLVVFAGLLKS